MSAELPDCYATSAKSQIERLIEIDGEAEKDVVWAADVKLIRAYVCVSPEKMAIN